MSVILQPRHDPADLRRLAELGITALDWRNPPEVPMRVFFIESVETENTALKDIVKGLSIAGISAHMRDPGAANAHDADAVVIRFVADATVAPAAADQSASVLPALAYLRGNPAAKRQAWSQLRALMRD